MDDPVRVNSAVDSDSVMTGNLAVTDSESADCEMGFGGEGFELGGERFALGGDGFGDVGLVGGFGFSGGDFGGGGSDSSRGFEVVMGSSDGRGTSMYSPFIDIMKNCDFRS